MWSKPAARWLSSPCSLVPKSSSAALAAATKSSTRRACLHESSTASQFRATPSEIPPQQTQSPPSPPEQPSPSFPPSLQAEQQNQQTDGTITATSTPAETTQPTIPASKTPIPPTFTSPLRLTPRVTSLLPYLRVQRSHYITAHVHANACLLTEGDTLRVPFLMPDVEPGDVIRLNRASVLGSRDFTLRGAPYIDERLFECRLRVLGTEAEPLRIKEKTKRRQRHVKTVKSKHKYTVFRVMEVKVKGVEELVEEGAQVVNEE